jgi:hypothetical protein
MCKKYETLEAIMQSMVRNDPKEFATKVREYILLQAGMDELVAVDRAPAMDYTMHGTLVMRALMRLNELYHDKDLARIRAILDSEPANTRPI